MHPCPGLGTNDASLHISPRDPKIIRAVFYFIRIFVVHYHVRQSVVACGGVIDYYLESINFSETFRYGEGFRLIPQQETANCPLFARLGPSVSAPLSVPFIYRHMLRLGKWAPDA
jgi:hypothetical protein